MNNWIENALNSNSPTILIASVILGIFGAFSSCCNYAIIASIVGYVSNFSANSSKKARNFFIITFSIGSIISIAIVGAIAGFIGSSIVSSIGEYWKLASGIILILLGLFSLQLIKLNISSNIKTFNYGIFSGFILGIITGGISIASSTCCSPALPIILSVSFIQASVFWGFIIMLFFAIGYTIPFTIGIFGLQFSIGKLNKISKYVSIIAGILMILTGFYLILDY